jgi:Ca2+-binding RTX toxin-like protein
MAFDGSTIANATTANLVSFVFSDTFSIDSTNDVDMVAITLQTGRTYNFDIDNGAAGDLYLRIFDAFGSEVRANDDGFRFGDNVEFSLSPYLEFAPNYSGTYYVAVSAYFLQGYNPFTTLGRSGLVENPIGIVSGTLSIIDAAQPNWPTAASINAIGFETSSDLTDDLRDEGRSHRLPFIGNLSDGVDIDMARMDLVKGDVVVIDVNGLDGTSTTIRVFNQSNTQIGIDDLAGFHSDPELIFGAPSAGSYHVAISGDGNVTYNPVDGTGLVASLFTGDYEVILHLNPTMIGSSNAQVINSGSASDYVVALSGNDTVTGNNGDDTLAGGDEQDSMAGGRGLDVLYGEHGNDSLFGGDDSDVLSGGIGDDLLKGDKGADRLEGGSGNDSMDGGPGNSNDTLDGGEGNDTLVGDKGDDRLLGGVGNDGLDGGNNDDALDGGSGNDSLLGGSGNDALVGSFDNDTLDGGGNDDALDGGSGNDSLLGGGGNDALTGSFGDDTLLGGNGIDRLIGGIGNDLLTGGLGDDSFVFAAVNEGVDTIADFIVASGDVIDLTLLFGAGVVNAGNLSQFVQTSTSGVADSFLAVDANGLTGGLSFTIIAQVIGVTSVELFDSTHFVL